MAGIGTTGPQHGRAQSRGKAGRRRTLTLVSALAAIALVALGYAGSAGARVVRDAAAHPLAESAPKVTQQPTNTSVTVGSSAKFISTASGTPTPTVQWERSTDGGVTFLPIEGATSSTYTIPATTSAENGYKFRAVFTNTVGKATSTAATLTVFFKPEITLQPVDSFTPEGKEATFTSTAAGGPTPTVQWQESTNGGAEYKNLAGQTSTTLKLPSVNKTEEGWMFRAVFTNSSGSATSEAATLHVTNPPHIQIEPVEKTVLEGETAEYKSTASGNPAPTIQWERSTNGGASYLPIEGATSESYVIASATVAEDGYRFRAKWTNSVGTATSSGALLTVRTVPKITEQPEPQIALAGGSVSFEAEASGHPTPSVQWQESSNGGSTFTPVSGATSPTLTIAEVQGSESGHLFRAVFTNPAGTATTEAASLTVSTTDYGAYGWGANKNSQTGTGSASAFLPTPAALPELGFVTQVAAGGKFGLALRGDGSVESWGANPHGQLGNEGAVGVTTPELIEHLGHVTEVAAGANHSLALLANGTVDAWGAGEEGQLGDGKFTDSEVPVPVAGLTGVKAIAAGEEHSLALLSNGTVMAWGFNEDGQLGNGNVNTTDKPVQVQGLSGVTAIAAGGNFSMALLSDGTVVAWGADARYQLGNEQVPLEEKPETPLMSTTPVPVDGLSNVKAIAAGTRHALALLQDGTVESWGDDAQGELGNGRIEERNNKAEPVPGLSGVTTISAGLEISAAVLSSGKVETWGENASGSLGDGSSGEPSDVPVQVAGLSQVIGVSAGGGHMLAFGEALPVVTGVSPKEGPTAGGATVTITGANLGGATEVHFGGAAATNVTVNNGGSVTATSPAGTGTVDVTVTTSSGTSGTRFADRYTYRTPPAVIKLSAKGGPATGGTMLTITGTGFAGAKEVTFAGVPATNFTVSGNATITVVSPVGVAGPADVRVTTIGGPSPIVKKDQFRYAPVIEEVSPPNGPEAGENTVTITGVGFPVGANTVKFKFGKKASKSAQCTTSTNCTAVVPASKTLGTVDVLATANKGKSTAVPGDHYTYE